MKNVDLRIQLGNISLRKLAKHMGMHENTLYNWFSKDMNEVERGRVVNAINEIKNK